MDIVALAAVEQVTLRTRFQACLAELHACDGRFAPPTLTALMRTPSLPASLSIQPQPSFLNDPAHSAQPSSAVSPPSNSQAMNASSPTSFVPRLHLPGAASAIPADNVAAANPSHGALAASSSMQPGDAASIEQMDSRRTATCAGELQADQADLLFQVAPHSPSARVDCLGSGPWSTAQFIVSGGF